MKALYSIIAGLFEYIKKYINHYIKFGWGGIVLLRNVSGPSKTIQFSIKNIAYPLFLRNRSSDIDTFYQIFSFKQYQLKKKINPKFIIDCGANVGYSSIYFANTYPDAVIVAVEPEPANFQMLLKNTAPYRNINCLQNGIWNKKTNLEIVDFGGGAASFVTKEVTYKKENTIEAISINEIMESYGVAEIDILKIDIEGSEKKMFEENFETFLPHTNIIIIELHDRYVPGCSRSFFKALVNYDFVMSHKGDNIICYLNNCHKQNV